MRRPQSRLWRSQRTSSRSRALLLAALLLLLLALLQLLGGAPLLGGPASAPASAPSCVQDRSTNALLPPTLRAASDAARGAHVAIISTWPPTKCGIATFSAGLREGLLSAGAHRVDVLAMHLRSSPPAQYGPEVRAARPRASVGRLRAPTARSAVSHTTAVTPSHAPRRR